VKIDTQLPNKFRSDLTKDEPQSVIYAPTDSKPSDDIKTSPKSGAGSSEATVVSPVTPEAVTSPSEKVCMF